MRVIGLTGQIATGKSLAARYLRDLGCPVFDADRQVHALLETDGHIIQSIAARFPDVVADNRVQRSLLRSYVFKDRQHKVWLEDMLHPKVRKAIQQFLQEHHRRRTPVVVLDIPLLFEAGFAKHCHQCVNITTAPFIQYQRMGLRGLSVQIQQAIVHQQWPNTSRQMLADVILRSGTGKREIRNTLHRMLLQSTLTRIRNAPHAHATWIASRAHQR